MPDSETLRLLSIILNRHQDICGALGSAKEQGEKLDLIEAANVAIGDAITKLCPG